MDLKNWKLKRRQIKAMKEQNAFNDFMNLPYHCPKCHWGTDTKEAYIKHLEGHLLRRKKK